MRCFNLLFSRDSVVCCSHPGSGDCGKRLNGIPARRPSEYKTMSKSSKRVTRAYGGNVCAPCVRSRIVRAFLEEEKKAVKSVLMQKKKQGSS